ncbi:MAG: transglycosylase SLT domain-containing protein [Bacteroidetes bacterium]|nr:transglycosylase SLT domain-containing protein [Bacteroidota bacterium]
MKKIFILFTLLFSTNAYAFDYNWGKEDSHGFQDVKGVEIDSLVESFYTDIFKSYNEFSEELLQVDSLKTFVLAKNVPDSVYANRLDMLNSPINLPYNNIVRRYINVYTNPRGSFKIILGRAQYYMPMFEEELYRMGLPTELKMLPVIESALNPSVVSPMGAAGLWQFMYATGRYYGLRQDYFVDQRLDPRASTKAACRFLKDLYKIYGNWTLALAAYNCGPGNVNKALRRVPGAKTYWDIYYYLPTETRGYVPAFIGATYAYTFYKAHDLNIVSVKHPVVTDTVMIVNKNMHFKQVTSTIDISEQTLRNLNPSYRENIVPAKLTKYPLVLPVSIIADFITHQDEIMAKDSIYLKKYLGKNLSAPKDRGFIYHRVKSGEYLGMISRKYHVPTAKIRRWNHIKNDKHLKIGQKLKIYKR